MTIEEAASKVKAPVIKDESSRPVMTVGILGGSFNPVHNGHIAVAKAVIKAGMADEVWLTLSPLNPLKANSSELAPDHDRLEMLRLATEGVNGLRVCDIELSMPRPSYTINTLNELSRIHPGIRFRLLIGADNMQIFNRWRAHDEIAERFSPIVYPRPGYKCEGCLDMDEFDISSTEIRRMLKDGENVNNLMPEKVVNYIRRHSLYTD